MRQIVTVDGLAGTGKSSLARLLAEKLHFQHLNTGLLYRVVGLLAARNELSVEDGKKIALIVDQSGMLLKRDGKKISFVELAGGEKLYYEDLQSEAVSSFASKVAVLAKIRAVLLEKQREAYPGFSLVAEGRDMGTVVFPDAKVKFFIKVPSKVRAERRYQQLIEAGLLPSEDPDFQKKQLESSILARDERDTRRALAPCIPAHDAIIFDNSRLSLTEAVSELYHLASARLTRTA